MADADGGGPGEAGAEGEGRVGGVTALRLYGGGSWTADDTETNGVERMYVEDGEIVIRGSDMALEIANPSVVSKVERLARRTGLSKTAAVEQAVDRMLKDLAAPGAETAIARAVG